MRSKDLSRRGSCRLWALHTFAASGARRENLALAAGVAAILGHNYTCWLRFKGGKGIATSGGVVLAWAPEACLTALGLWGLVFVATRYVSLASIAAALVLPFAVWFWNGSPTMTCVMSALSLLAIYKHKGEHPAPAQRHGESNRAKRKTDMKVTVIGAGAWGTALANLLCQTDHCRHPLGARSPRSWRKSPPAGRNDLVPAGHRAVARNPLRRWI